MAANVSEPKSDLDKIKKEYESIFELVPCYITVQDRDFKLLKYNREFSEQFEPKPGDYCFYAYKGRSERCEICPVIETFEDGESHFSEEIGLNKDGEESTWLVRTAPVKNDQGEVVAAIEMSLDITHTKFLEKEARASEEKYQTIFNTIPNPVFILEPETLLILDCNESVTSIYGFEKDEIIQTSFMDLFDRNERKELRSQILSNELMSRIRQIRKNGEVIYVTVRISRTIYSGHVVLLVTTSDTTKRMMAEQLMIQTSKMATLGEMATGIAHELNQPLSVLKTASSFILKKIKKREPIEEDILQALATEIDSHVDRASKIINHMREFGRKSEVKKGEVDVNLALNKALEIFSQQLKLRQIEVIMEFDENLPPILADSNRLEQVFINLLINSRDAIEDKSERGFGSPENKKIHLKTSLDRNWVKIEIRDSGTGIPDSIKEKIFEPFFTTKKVGKGTGLGLSISYGIVQDYDGTIRVESREGEGSNFIIQFPLMSKN